MSPFKRRFVGGWTFRGGNRLLAFPVDHKMISSQQNSFWKFHVLFRSVLHTNHRFHYGFHWWNNFTKPRGPRTINRKQNWGSGVRRVTFAKGRRQLVVRWSETRSGARIAGGPGRGGSAETFYGINSQKPPLKTG